MQGGINHKVTVQQGGPAWEIAYHAIKEIFHDNVQGKHVLLKPSIGRIGPEKSAVCTHPEVVRGLIRFFYHMGAEHVYVGDGAIAGVDEWEALKSSGIMKTCQEEHATPVDLDEFQPWKKYIPNGVIVNSLNFTSFINQVDLIVSVPVLKTHMYTTATLSIKNMKGCLYKKEKTRLHRSVVEPPDRSKGLTLDYGIADMAEVLLPDYSVIDGIVGMEGFGPSIGTPVPLDLVVASKNPVSADYIAVQLMGMAYDAIPHVNLTLERIKSTAFKDIKVEPGNYLDYSRPFALPTTEKFKDYFPNATIVEKGSCSACSASIMSFLRAYHDKLPEDFAYTLAAGKDLDPTDLTTGAILLIGNCAKAYKDEYGMCFCPGCPPVGSRIMDQVNRIQRSDS